MQKTLATVNINMGLGKQNPVLIIKRSTNVPNLVTQFIHSYQLPQCAYDIIMDAIEKQLTKENIDIETLGRPSCEKQAKPALICRKQPSGKQNIQRIDTKNKKQTISWDQVKAKKQLPINRIQFQKKSTSPVFTQKFKQRQQLKRQDPKTTKITLIRAKSPIIRKDRSPFETKRTISPVQNRTPLRERQMTEQQRHQTNTVQRQRSRHNHSRQRQRQQQPTRQPLISMPFEHHNHPASHETQILLQIYSMLTRNQPKTIQIISPQYVTFTGIKPQVLAVLQQFFEQIEEHEFASMDRAYFLRRLKNMDMASRLYMAVVGTNDNSQI